MRVTTTSWDGQANDSGVRERNPAGHTPPGNNATVRAGAGSQGGSASPSSSPSGWVLSSGL